MYFLNLGAMKRELADEQVSARDLAIYVGLMLGFALPIFFPVQLRPGADYTLSLRILAETIATFVVVFYGVRACYRANGAELGKNFAERFVSLGWVVAFRVGLVSQPLFYLLVTQFPEYSYYFGRPYSLLVRILTFVFLTRAFSQLIAKTAHAA